MKRRLTSIPLVSLASVALAASLALAGLTAACGGQNASSPPETVDATAPPTPEASTSPYAAECVGAAVPPLTID